MKQCYVKRKYLPPVLYDTAPSPYIADLVLKSYFMKLNKFQQAFGARVCSAREAKGLSKTQLAKLTEMAVTHITQTEDGVRNTCLDSIRRLSIVLEVEAKFFFDWE